MAVENSRLVGELEAIKHQVNEQTTIIRDIASGAAATLGTAVAPGPSSVPRRRVAGEKKTPKKAE